MISLLIKVCIWKSTQISAFVNFRESDERANADLLKKLTPAITSVVDIDDVHTQTHIHTQ